MTDGIRSGLGIAALLLASACGGQEVREPALNQAAEAGSNETAELNLSIPAPAPTEGALSKYVGKHPSDEVDGGRFLDEATVKAAVAATVPHAAVRKFVFNYDGPDAPIVVKDGRILAWGCERHNCGYHNWAILITPDGASADVCYYDNDDRPDGPSTWYLQGAKTEQRAGSCPSE